MIKTTKKRKKRLCYICGKEGYHEEKDCPERIQI